MSIVNVIRILYFFSLSTFSGQLDFHFHKIGPLVALNYASLLYNNMAIQYSSIGTPLTGMGVARASEEYIHITYIYIYVRTVHVDRNSIVKLRFTYSSDECLSLSVYSSIL